MNFVALDFETANADLGSICQVGIVSFRDGEVASTFVSLIDPEDFFDSVNISIHGIDSKKVRGAPKFTEVYREIVRITQDNVVACHTLFDRTALSQAETRHKLSSVTCKWLDVTRVVRRAWPQYAHAGYGLKNLAHEFNYEFKHHDALEDARVTGMILMRAIQESGVSLDDWLVRVTQPIFESEKGGIKRKGNPCGPLHGEVAVFTGQLSLPRRVAADLAAAAGCKVDAGVTKLTTLLIVGDQDVMRLAEGQVKSNKHLKAEALIAKGQEIRILRETDFAKLVGGDG